jgi:radical SAM-linked protein
MKIRIKFTKTGTMKFIGHLDIMRYFQKAFRRAEIDIEYSKGFNPHQIMSFAAPLGVGLTSQGEYLDVSLLSCEEPKVMIEKINGAMNENIQVTGFHFLSDNSKNAMSIVAAADYKVAVKDGYEFLDKAVFEEKFRAFYQQEEITIIKKSKKSENQVDIKPSIYHIGFELDEFTNKIGQYRESTVDISESYENDVKIYMQLATGSVNNLKPELVIEAFCEYAGLTFHEFAFQVHRMEVYAEDNNGKKSSDALDTERKLIPLEAMD